MIFLLILGNSILCIIDLAYGAPMPQETPANTSANPNFEHFANFGARVAQPLVLAPQPVGAVGGIIPLFNALPLLA